MVFFFTPAWTHHLKKWGGDGRPAPATSHGGFPWGISQNSWFIVFIMVNQWWIVVNNGIFMVNTLVGGLEHSLFSISYMDIYGIILPIDELICSRWFFKPPTSFSYLQWTIRKITWMIFWGTPWHPLKTGNLRPWDPQNGDTPSSICVPKILVNLYITWKDPPFLMGKLTISMAIFNSYISLPEGRFFRLYS